MHSPFARLALATLPLLALTACSDLRETDARDVLRDAGYERIVVSPESWLTGPCQWTERYAVRFVGTKDGRRWDGVMCATGEAAQDARIIAVAVIRPAPDWQSFRRSGR